MAALLKYVKWPQEVGSIHVRFIEGDPAVHRLIEKIVTGADGWNSACAKQFVFDNRPDAQIRVSFRQGSSWSYEGTSALAIGGEPSMNLTDMKPDMNQGQARRMVLHEFGHALGLVHEHQNPLANIPWNVPAVYAWYARFGWDHDFITGVVLSKVDPAAVATYGYDNESIMHYNLDRSILLHDGWYGSRGVLSAMDRYLIGKEYGPSPWNPIVTPPTGFKIYLPLVEGHDKPTVFPASSPPSKSICLD